MRNKIQKDKRHSNSYIDDACPSQTLDFVEILKAENYKKISEENRRKSNIFSMVLRIWAATIKYTDIDAYTDLNIEYIAGLWVIISNDQYVFFTRSDFT
jgi:hypothetical protein